MYLGAIVFLDEKLLWACIRVAFALFATTFVVVSDLCAILVITEYVPGVMA
jgi:hypothetical protein